jgi:quercetin dioxygenase-like cupin family protein
MADSTRVRGAGSQIIRLRSEALVKHLRASRKHRDETTAAVETRLLRALDLDENLKRLASDDFLKLTANGIQSLERPRVTELNLWAREIDFIADVYRVSPLLLQSLQPSPRLGECVAQSLGQFQPTREKFGNHATYLVPTEYLGGTEDVQIVYLEIQPGGWSDTHAHPGDELLVVLDGEIEVRLENSGLRTPIGRGQYIHFYAEQTHSVLNNSSRPARAFVIRFYQFEHSGVRKALKSLKGDKLSEHRLRRLKEEIQASLRFAMAVQREAAPEVLDRFGLGRLLEKCCRETFRGPDNALTIDDLQERAAHYNWSRSTMGRLHQGIVPVSAEELHVLAAIYDVKPFLLFDFLFPALRNAIVVRPDEDMVSIPDDFLPTTRVNYSVPCRRLEESDVAICTVDLPGQTTSPENAHPGYELVIALEGEVILSLDRRTIEIGAHNYGFAHFKSALPHHLANEGRQRARVLVVRFYE